MGLSTSFISDFSMKNYNTLNKKIINMKKQDSILSHLVSLFEQFSQINKHIKFIKYQQVEIFKDLINSGKSKDRFHKKKITNVVEVNRSFYEKYEFIFSLTLYKDGKTSKLTKSLILDIPIMKNNFFYYLKGNEYYAPFQLTDLFTNTINERTISLKTNMKSLTIQKENTILKDHLKNKFDGDVFYISVINKKIPLILHFAAKFGLYQTISFFVKKGLIYVSKVSPKEKDYKFIYFPFGRFYILVDRDIFNNNKNLRNFIASLLTIANTKIEFNESRNVNYWVIKLGEYISKIKSLEKGKSLMNSLDNSLDPKTVKNIEFFLNKKGYDNIYSITRWIFMNIDILLQKKNDFKNMRIRTSEYLIAPLYTLLTKNLFRFVNSPNKTKDMQKLSNVLNIDSNILISSIISSSAKNSNNFSRIDITRFHSQPNDLSIFQILSTVTGGPGSLSTRTKIREAYTSSMIGVMDPYTTPPGNPGESYILNPFLRFSNSNLGIL